MARRLLNYEESIQHLLANPRASINSIKSQLSNRYDARTKLTAIFTLRLDDRNAKRLARLLHAGDSSCAEIAHLLTTDSERQSNQLRNELQGESWGGEYDPNVDFTHLAYMHQVICRATPEVLVQWLSDPRLTATLSQVHLNSPVSPPRHPGLRLTPAVPTASLPTPPAIAAIKPSCHNVSAKWWLVQSRLDQLHARRHSRCRSICRGFGLWNRHVSA